MVGLNRGQLEDYCEVVGLDWGKFKGQVIMSWQDGLVSSTLPVLSPRQSFVHHLSAPEVLNIDRIDGHISYLNSVQVGRDIQMFPASTVYRPG